MTDPHFQKIPYPESKKNEAGRFVLPFFLVMLVFGTFFPVVSYESVHFDDDLYVFGHPYIRQGMTPEGLSWILRAGFTEANHADYWIPLTYLSRMVDVELFGEKPAGHHLVNLFLHLMNVLLLFACLKRMTQDSWAAFAAAAIFAIHPVQAEAVSWISARKDVLSGFFIFLALYAYIIYAETRSKWGYFTAFLFFICALMSKPVALVVPLLFFCVDFWPFNRLQTWQDLRKLIIEKIPFWIVFFVYLPLPFMSQETIWQKPSLPGLLGNFFMIPFWYLGKIFFPAGLGLYGPSSIITYSGPGIFLYAVPYILISLGAVRWARKAPYFCFGWFWYLFSVSSAFAASPPANRFIYIPLIGIAVGVVWFLKNIAPEKGRKFLLALFILLLVFFWFGARAHSATWSTSETLFQQALKINPRNFVAISDMGNLFASRGEAEKAMAHYQEALRLKPDYVQAMNNMALALLQQGKNEEAIQYLKKAVQLVPEMAPAYFNLGNIYMNTLRDDEAEAAYAAAIKIEPRYLNAYINLGTLYVAQRKYEKAAEQFKTVLKIDPTNRAARKALEYTQSYLSSSKQSQNLEVESVL